MLRILLEFTVKSIYLEMGTDEISDFRIQCALETWMVSVDRAVHSHGHK